MTECDWEQVQLNAYGELKDYSSAYCLMYVDSRHKGFFEGEDSLFGQLLGASPGFFLRGEGEGCINTYVGKVRVDIRR